MSACIERMPCCHKSIENKACSCNSEKKDKDCCTQPQAYRSSLLFLAVTVDALGKSTGPKTKEGLERTKRKACTSFT